MKDVPIFICAKDRASFLKIQVERFLEQGYRNLTVLDMGSTYPPMLSLLNKLPAKVLRIGLVACPHLHVWKDKSILAGLPWYVYTDCDVVPDCPDNWAEALHSILTMYPQIEKAGLGLRLDDLPEHYARRQEVRQWESIFWLNELETGVFVAEIDTTLALYRGNYKRPEIIANTDNMFSARTGHPYVAKHLPWYSNTAHPTPEELYYRQHADPHVGHWK